MFKAVTHVGSSLAVTSSSSSMACLCHTGLASTGSVSTANDTKNVEHRCNSAFKAGQNTKSPTFGLVAGHSHQTLLFDVGFGGGVAASGVQSPVIDAQHHPVAQPLTTGHCTLVIAGYVVCYLLTDCMC